jgi:hypothetical protein
MPSEHYMVEGHLLLGVAAEDILHADEIRTILKVCKQFIFWHNFIVYICVLYVKFLK